MARLLGLRLLTLDAGVMVSPARSPRSPRAGVTLAEARRGVTVSPARSPRSARAGVTLAEARRALDEGAAALAAGRAPSGSRTPSRQV